MKNCTLKPYFYIFVEHFLYIDLCTHRYRTCRRIFQTSARKPRNQCKHQQLCVKFPISGPILLRRRSEKCVTKGSKYAHWIGLYLRFHLSWVLSPFVHGRLQNLKTNEDTFGHDITPLSMFMYISGITAFAQPFTDSGSMPNLDNPQFSQPTPPPAYPSHTTLESQLLSLTEPTLSNVMPAQTILSTSTAPPNSVYTPIVAQQQPTEPAYVIVPSVTPVQQQSWTPVIATHLAPGIAVVPKEEFVKPKVYLMFKWIKQALFLRVAFCL